jgi:hypothetical protein
VVTSNRLMALMIRPRGMRQTVRRIKSTILNLRLSSRILTARRAFIFSALPWFGIRFLFSRRPGRVHPGLDCSWVDLAAWADRTDIAQELGITKQALSRGVAKFLRMSGAIQPSGLEPAFGLKCPEARRHYQVTNGVRFEA